MYSLVRAVYECFPHGNKSYDIRFSMLEFSRGLARKDHCQRLLALQAYAITRTERGSGIDRHASTGSNDGSSGFASASESHGEVASQIGESTEDETSQVAKTSEGVTPQVAKTS